MNLSSFSAPPHLAVIGYAVDVAVRQGALDGLVDGPHVVHSRSGAKFGAKGMSRLPSLIFAFGPPYCSVKRYEQKRRPSVVDKNVGLIKQPSMRFCVMVRSWR